MILDGRKISKKITEEVKSKVESLDKKPGLALIYIGKDESSKVYSKMIVKKAKSVGFNIETVIEETMDQESILDKIESFNKSDLIHGIIVQFPLPKDIDEEKVRNAIDYRKDVDSAGVINTGNLYLGNDAFIPCTPKAMTRILEEYNLDNEGSKVVIVGRSNVVGKPLYECLNRKNMTVTICHSRTKNLREHTLDADIVCTAVGKRNIISSDDVSRNCVVIDAGINVEADGMYGDVDYVSLENHVSWITPVPGGVGPVTTAILLENTLEAYYKNEA
ncbi:MAG: bifunctional 5,10-methylenetetrahydrofolate dehydrogenase/5,10-methenyltetrahydrofolate cyclohydrolase [Firmicutes bacterium]|nr:bifunctional 5,10-methylenetetrahydrofolate dehydrogenase/5,10-methenyltetrahydrofolate cyclohydrolase [Bacillota bacterium]